MATGQTLTLNKNVVSSKKLIGIANFIGVNSEAMTLSAGNDILSTDQEIRDTKKAQVLMPLLVEVLDVKTLLSQFKRGGVEFNEMELNEFIVELANEKATKPLMYRPRDGETISADSLVDRYKNSLQISSMVAVDRAYYANIFNSIAGIKVAVGGVTTGGSLKPAVVKATAIDNSSVDKIKESGTLFTNQIRTERAKQKKHKDKLTQNKFKNSDFALVINADREVVIQNDVRYNVYTEKATNESGVFDGDLDGTPYIVSKQLPDNVDFLLMLRGSAVSLFAIRNYLNVDKANGVHAFGITLEFDEGTGVFLPHMITIGVNDATAPQAAVGFDALVLDMNLSETKSGNETNTAGLEDGGLGSVVTLAEVDALTEPQADNFAALENIDLTGAADLDAKKTLIKTQLGLA